MDNRKHFHQRNKIGNNETNHNKSRFGTHNHSCVGAIANRGQWEQGCNLLMATDLGPVRATHKKKKTEQNKIMKAAS